MTRYKFSSAIFAAAISIGLTAVTFAATNVPFATSSAAAAHFARI